MILQAFEGGPFQENAYLAACEESGVCAVVDPGGGTPALLAAVEAAGYDLRAILLTHAHLDHVDGIPHVRRFAPDAAIYLHPQDRPLYDAAAQQARAFGLPVPDLPPPDRTFPMDQELSLAPGLRFQVRFTPGHAPGHVILVAKGEPVALVGDVIFAGSIGRTDLPGGDLATLMRSIQSQVLSLPDPVRLLPGHGPETTVGRERTTNPFVLGILGS